MTTHTPGPWTFKEYKQHTINSVADGMIESQDGAHLADVYAVGDSDGNYTATHNANLIAAAPDLLEAVKLCADYLRDAGDDTGVPAILNAALAKAEGR